MGEGDREERRGRYLTQAGRDLGGFVPPAFRQLVGMAEDQFKVWRAKRQVRLREQFQEFLFDRGLDAPTRSIAPAFMLPLIERASLEADDALQDVWAMLLANAADADCSTEMRMAFISMLSEMTSLDVASCPSWIARSRRSTRRIICKHGTCLRRWAAMEKHASRQAISRCRS
jgi:hypothetical protein